MGDGKWRDISYRQDGLLCVCTGDAFIRVCKRKDMGDVIDMKPIITAGEHFLNS